MTRHPQHLYATAELHSLLGAWPHLQGAVDAARAAAHDDGDLGTLQAWRPNTGGSGGGGVRSVILDAVAESRRWSVVSAYERRQTGVVASAYWLAERLAPDLVDAPVPDVLRALLDLVPRLPPTTAGNVGRHIADEDRALRELLYLGTDRAKLTGVRCPACRERRVEVRTSNPDLDARPYVCAAGCTCSGAGCPCGMTVPTVGVGHIWTRAELVAIVKARASE